MDAQNSSKGNAAAIITMFALFFMIAFVTNFASPMGVIAKNQFNASNALSQLGNAANFIAYLFMGIPGGLILKRKGYKFTALAAVAVGFLGVGVQLVSGYVSSFAVYVLGAFIAGFSMCMLNLVVNPMLNTLGGGGNKGNQLVQFGCSLNSVGATLSPAVDYPATPSQTVSIPLYDRVNAANKFENGKRYVFHLGISLDGANNEIHFSPVVEGWNTEDINGITVDAINACLM